MVMKLNRGRPVKDAASAVHRVENLDIQKVTPDSLTELLGIPTMRVTHFAIESEGEEQSLHMFCGHVHNVAVCPGCSQPSQEGYDHQERCVRHLDIWGMRTLIHFSQRRFECEVCGKPFSERLSWIAPKRRQTEAFEEHVYQRVLVTPRKHVALGEGLSESTVLDIFKKRAKGHQEERESGYALGKQFVQVLGVDEISLRKGHKQYALVLSDIQRRCVIAVLPERTKEAFEQWISALSVQERNAIKWVSMDMWKPYRQAVRKKLPKARIVADRFHVMKQLNHQIDCLRRSMQRTANNEGDEPLMAALKGNCWILVKNRDELNAEEEARLQLILAASSELLKLYLLKEEFRLICDKIRDRTRAVLFLRGWYLKALATGNPYLKKFVATLRSWWDEFLNYFEERITQGFVEGVNRAIRGIINRAFGFRVFDHFRMQVLAECGTKEGSG